jgi:26S proteasome regulatory subunit N7
MAPYLETLLAASPPVISPDSSLLPKLKALNETKLAEFDAKLVEAEEREGETEVSDILRAKAAYLTKIGDRVRCRPSLLYPSSSPGPSINISPVEL